MPILNIGAYTGNNLYRKERMIFMTPKMMEVLLDFKEELAKPRPDLQKFTVNGQVQISMISLLRLRDCMKKAI